MHWRGCTRGANLARFPWESLSTGGHNAPIPKDRCANARRPRYSQEQRGWRLQLPQIRQQCRSLFRLRRADASIRAGEQVLALDERVDNARAHLIRSLIGKGDYARALAEYDKHPMQTPGSNAFRAQALALSGRREEALAELDRVLDLSKERYVAAYDIALIYAALADAVNAFLWLERALEEKSTLINFLALDPILGTLHADERFDSLVRRTGIYRRVLPDDPAASNPTHP